MNSLEYSVETIDSKDIDSIRPLWEELNGHHAGISTHFGPYFNAMTFAKRKAQFLEKTETGELHIDACFRSIGREVVGYCVSNIVKATGEIDSLFVNKEHRGSGAGSLLVEAAMAWIRSRGVEGIMVHVAVGNEGAMNFYRRFGLFPRLILLTNKNFPETTHLSTPPP
jgi:diamine N-acetyltransferase